MNLSDIILGTSNYGSRVSPSQSVKLIKLAHSHGINTFDTSPLYGFGLSEKIVGVATRSIDRNNIIINTKVGLNPTKKIILIRKFILPLVRKIIFKSPSTKKINTRGVIEDKILSSKEIKESVNNSLKNLKTNYIDTLFIHTNYRRYLSKEENVSIFQSLLKNNKIKYLGITTGLTEPDEIDWINTNIIINHIQIPFTKRHLVKKIRREIKISYYSPFKGLNNPEETYRQITAWCIEKQETEKIVINFANKNTINKHIHNIKSI